MSRGDYLSDLFKALGKGRSKTGVSGGQANSILYRSIKSVDGNCSEHIFA
jgi:hypothetical protein